VAKSNVNTNQDKLESAIDKGVNKFLKKIPGMENDIFRTLLSQLKDLKLTTDGQIKQTVQNLRKADQVRRTVEQIVLNPDYEKNVEQFLGTYNEVEQINTGYLKTIEKTFDPSDIRYQYLKDTSVELMVNSLTEQGVAENVIKPIQDVIRTSVTDGMFFDDMVDALRKNVKGDKEVMGLMQRYASQIMWDGVQEYNRNYSYTFAQGEDKEWFRYTSGLVRDSRDYCRRRQGRYFHRKEIEDVPSAQWSGKKKGTNSSTIFKYCGGYNCKHHYQPVLIDIVPKEVILRNIKNGNFSPKGKDKKEVEKIIGEKIAA